MKYYVGIIVVVIGAIIYGAQTFLNIDIIALIIPDTEKPTIDISSVRTTVTLDGNFDISEVTCEDNYDDECEVVVSGSIDTSQLGTQSITFRATDNAGNTATESIIVTIIEGLDTTMYVPAGYYDGIAGLTAEELKNALNDIITDHHELPYTDKTGPEDVWRMLRDADEDPENSDNVILFYSGFSWPKECQDTNTSLLPDYCFENGDREADYTEWNREHIWSKSHGDFTEANEAEGAHTDGHHLVAAERAMNSTKNNRFFDDCHDGINDDDLVDRGFGNYTCGEWYFEPRDEVKGDVARMIFYMAVRYEGEEDNLYGDYVDLEITNDLYNYENSETAIKNSKMPYYENLSVLLRWHIEDPVDEWELERNESIYQIQGNRNPFIDHPELVELIWGTPDNPIEYVSSME